MAHEEVMCSGELPRGFGIIIIVTVTVTKGDIIGVVLAIINCFLHYYCYHLLVILLIKLSQLS